MNYIPIEVLNNINKYKFDPNDILDTKYDKIRLYYLLLKEFKYNDNNDVINFNIYISPDCYIDIDKLMYTIEICAYFKQYSINTTNIQKRIYTVKNKKYGDFVKAILLQGKLISDEFVILWLESVIKLIGNYRLSSILQAATLDVSFSHIRICNN
jgi:hypothetical protein